MSFKIAPVWIVLTLMTLGRNAIGAEFTPPVTVLIAAGPFSMGSSLEERNAAHTLDETAYGHDVTRKGRWYASESAPHTVTTKSFQITRTPITNADYAQFIVETSHPPPTVDAKTWAGYGLNHPFKTVQRHTWINGAPPPGRELHPVVLVAHADGVAYAQWLSAKTKQTWHLPSEIQWEKAMRGPDGRRFPWGNTFDPTALNSHDNGPFDTLPVGRFVKGASPYGVLDGAGQVFEWTADSPQKDRFIVKGGSWDDQGCGVCRPAARHTRPANLKHILIGFRLVREVRR